MSFFSFFITRSQMVHAFLILSMKEKVPCFLFFKKRILLLKENIRFLFFSSKEFFLFSTKNDMYVYALGYQVLRTKTLKAHLHLCRESITTNGSPFKVCFSSAGNMVIVL